PGFPAEMKADQLVTGPGVEVITVPSCAISLNFSPGVFALPFAEKDVVAAAATHTSCPGGMFSFDTVMPDAHADAVPASTSAVIAPAPPAASAILISFLDIVALLPGHCPSLRYVGKVEAAASQMADHSPPSCRPIPVRTAHRDVIGRYSVKDWNRDCVSDRALPGEERPHRGADGRGE